MALSICLEGDSVPLAKLHLVSNLQSSVFLDLSEIPLGGHLEGIIALHLSNFLDRLMKVEALQAIGVSRLVFSIDGSKSLESTWLSFLELIGSCLN